MHVGYLGDVFDETDPQAKLVKAATAEQKGDILTKEVDRKRFEECKNMLQVVQLTCCLPRAPRTLICKGGTLHPVASVLSELATPAKRLQSLLPGLNSWAVDSGSGYNLIPRKSVDKPENIKTVETQLVLRTTNGITKSFEKVMVYIPMLDADVEAWILEDTPLVLGLRNLIKEHGCRFTWACADKARLRRGAKSVELPVMQGVPVLKI